MRVGNRERDTSRDIGGDGEGVQVFFGRHPESPRVCRRRQLLRGWGYDDRRDDQRPLQGRGHPSAWSVVILRSRRVRDADLGRLVQQSPASGAHRQHSAGRSRGALLRSARRAANGSVT